MTARALAGAAALLAVAGCGQPQSEAVTADIGNAASEAQADIDDYAANTAQTNFTPPTAPTPTLPSRRAQAITPEDALANGAEASTADANARQ